MPETFSQLLLKEHGHRIVERLGAAADAVLPAACVLYGTDSRVSPETSWQVAAVLDMRRRHEHAAGTFQATSVGNRPVIVHTGFVDHHGDSILAGHMANEITWPMELGAVALDRVGQQIGFRYTICVEAGQA